MATTAEQPTQPVQDSAIDIKADPLQQAGGGATESHRAVHTLNEHVLLHLRRTYESLAGPSKTWGKDEITNFFQKIQHHDLPKLLETRTDLDLNGFLHYMTSGQAAITIPRPEEDLSWPLASYYISSSHNTYLSGNQLSSHSTTDTYKNVLLRGCRCVEIDVWDGDSSNELSPRTSHSSSSMSSKDEKKQAEKDKKWKNRLSRIESFRERLPDGLTERLEKTKLGKRLENRLDKYKNGKEVGGDAAAEMSKASTDEQSPIEKRGGQDTSDDSDELRGPAEPRVLHGHTFTREVSFRDVCVAIGENAFKVSDLPVIVSLEVHCNAQQQGMMVDIMKETWKGLLIEEPAEEPTELPSPESLKRKLLVKVKYAAPPGESTLEHIKEDQEHEHEASDEEERSSKADDPKGKKKKPSKIIQELSRLGVYTRGVSFKGFSQKEASMPTHIFSLSEKKLLSYHENYREDLIKHNTHYLMRAYPAGFRISSSNFNPALFWGSGAQIVALNWQQTDEGMMVNEGMFAGTGGYVLKPQGYRPDIETKPTAPKNKVLKSITLTITFLAAQSIPLPPGDTSRKGFRPYIKAELHTDGSPPGCGVGVGGAKGKQGNSGSHDKGTAEYKIRTNTHKGQDCDLLGQKLAFPTIDGLVEDLTFLRFTVRDNEFGRDELAAWACVRLDRLGDGYRSVHLTDAKGVVTEGVIFVKIEKTIS